jgi:double-stranded uracil-DNA glycosylase
MARFTRSELESFRDKPVEDLLGPDVRLLFVGINPGLWTAATNTHFCHPTNRFYPALRRAGVIDWDLDPGVGMDERQRADLVGAGIGITNLVNRATAKASELTAEELRTGGRRIHDLSKDLHPKVVAVAGVTAYRDAFSRPQAHLGRQSDAVGSGELWVVPNPSGLNAHETVESLSDWYRKVASAAGVI